MTVTVQHLRMSELLHHDDDATDETNDIDVSRMVTNGLPTTTYLLGEPKHSNYAYGKYFTTSTTFLDIQYYNITTVHVSGSGG